MSEMKADLQPTSNFFGLQALLAGPAGASLCMSSPNSKSDDFESCLPCVDMFAHQRDWRQLFAPLPVQQSSSQTSRLRRLLLLLLLLSSTCRQKHRPLVPDLILILSFFLSFFFYTTVPCRAVPCGSRCRLSRSLVVQTQETLDLHQLSSSLTSRRLGQ